MILGDRAILDRMERGSIVIEPFDRKALGSNSYDVHLAPTLCEYMLPYDYVVGCQAVLDCKRNNPTFPSTIPPEGFVLWPNTLYLASTVEYTETHDCVPFLEGKSSLGRLGLSIHVTAGKGDVGFRNHWTMEMTVVHPLRIYAGMPIGQLIYHEVAGMVANPYHKKDGAKYNERDSRPQPSRMHLNFTKEG